MRAAIKIDLFDNWSSEMAYILGFAMADGSIRHKD